MVMVQSLNSKAILTLASVLRRPSLIVPQVSVATVSDVKYEALRNHVDAVVFDKDNTLTAPYVNVIHPKAKKGLERAMSIFGEDKIAILSNSAGTKDDLDFRDALAIERELGIAVIRHEEKKPGGLEEVLNHFALNDATRLCVVGDRLLTDIVFGNLYGMLTIHTRPLCVGEENRNDNNVAKVIRRMENGLLYGSIIGKHMRKKPIAHKHWHGQQRLEL